MKIKCYNHNRRVMMIRNRNVPVEVIIHREDGSHCDTKSLIQGDKIIRYIPDDSIDLTRISE